MVAPVSTVLDIAAGEAPDWRLRRRARIVEAASRLFAERAYALVQMDDVAGAAGMSKATIYRYFRSKESLYLEIFDQALLALIDRIEEFRRRRLPPRETMSAIIAAIVETFVVHIGTLRSLLADDAELADRLRRVFRGRRREIHALLSRTIAEGIAGGTFRALDAATVPGVVIGMCWGGVMGAPGANPDSLARTIGGLFLDGACRPEKRERPAGSRRPARVSRQDNQEQSP
jgi:AcrR family transcriptional regulator